MNFLKAMFELHREQHIFQDELFRKEFVPQGLLTFFTFNKTFNLITKSEKDTKKLFWSCICISLNLIFFNQIENNQYLSVRISLGFVRMGNYA